jgi:hypothetical protein
MFLGHVAVGLAAKKPARRPSLGTLLLAVELPDLLWPIFLALGLERVYIVPGITAVSPLDFVSYPLSHSLLADVGWASLFAGIYYLAKKDTRGACWIWACVVSHWILDTISHRPDMPFYPGGHVESGFGLWNSRLATMTVEGALLAGGIYLYLGATRPRDTVGEWAFWSLMAVIVAIYLGMIFGPPPPSRHALEAMTLGLWLIPAWGYWIDRHRELRV